MKAMPHCHLTTAVVPAKAGTHNHRRQGLGKVVE
jgi:hypothetical protein